MHEKERMSAADVAVIITCYNYGRFLAEAIRSVLDQHTPVADVIVVDDGSTDETPEVCGAFEMIRYVRTENRGPSASRNEGLRHTRCSAVLFLDADDILLPRAIEVLWGGLDQCPPEVAGVFAISEYFGEEYAPGPEGSMQPNPSEVRPHRQSEHDGVCVLGRTILYRQVCSNVIPCCSALLRRAAVEEIGGWNERYPTHEDREFWLRLLAGRNVGFIDMPVACIRRHGSQITSSANWVRNHRNILSVLDDAVAAEWCTADLRIRLRRRYASTAYLLGRRLGDLGQPTSAARWMARSIIRNPLQPKAYCWMVNYFLTGLFRRQNDRGRAEQ